MMKRFFTFALIAMLSCAVAYAQGSGPQPRPPGGGGSGGGGTGGGGSGGGGTVPPNNSKDEKPLLFVFPSRVQTFEANGVKFSMTRVDGGTFRMGATPEQGTDADARTNERPVHSVTLNTYYIGTNKVTQALWEAVMNNRAASSKFGDLPVKCVSWDDCQLFISRLNALTGRDFRLPTEAEWEFACRGGNKSQGYKYSGSNDLNSVAWYGDNSCFQTHPIGQKRENELGIYDMSGNVWEWCSDWYGGYSSQPQHNPTGPPSGTERVCRGGSSYSAAMKCRTTYRRHKEPTESNHIVGLRLVLPAE